MIRRVFHNPYLAIVFRIVLGIVFIYAAVSKIADPFGFSIDIRNYHILPVILTNSAAVILPWIEFYCGLFLIVGLYTKTSARLISGMLILFILAITSALLRGFDISCGCFSAASDNSAVSVGKIIEDIFLLLLSVQIAFVRVQKIAVENLILKTIGK